MKKWLYDITYSLPFIPIPWDSGPKSELVHLVESGQIKPCRAIDLGCGTASNVIYLTQKGFDATGVDFSQAALELGKVKAEKAGIDIHLINDDLTNLQNTHGTYDLLIDYGVLDDLDHAQRDKYLDNVLPLTHTGSLFFFFCFEWHPRWWEKFLSINLSLKPGEVEERFGKFFSIELISKIKNASFLIPSFATYLLTRL